MNTKKLKELVLDLAIHGKLVPQDPNDEPASVLLERIRNEKERLVKEGKIKKSKSTTSSDTPPYENVPTSWAFTNLGSVFQHNTGKALNKSASQEGTLMPYITTSNVYWDCFELDNVKQMCFKDSEIDKCTVKKGDLLVCEGGDIGRSAIWPFDYTICIQNHIHRLRPKFDVSVKFYYFVLMLYKSQNSIEGKGIGMLGLSSGQLDKLMVPVPPVNEQKRIVTEIERWFSVIDALEANEGDLQKTIEQTKKKILDLAIRGKLVPQDPNDEPAGELLKKLGVSSDNRPYENVPFEVPKSWCWTTLGNISNYGSCTTVDVKSISEDAWILELEDIEKDTARILQRLSKSQREIKGVRHIFNEGVVLYSKLRTYLNKVLVAPEDGYSTTEIIPIEPEEGVDPKYIVHVLRSNYFLDYTAQCGYGVKMPRLSTSDARKSLIPLPPLAEQQRIVDKIEELFSQLDTIANALE